MQDKIAIKIVGKTVMTTLEGSALRANLEKDQKDALKELIEKFNKKPTQVILNKIKKFFVVKEVSKPKVEAKKAKVKEKTEKVTNAKAKKLSKLEAQINELLEKGKNDDITIKELREKLEKLETNKPAPASAPARRGEY